MDDYDWDALNYLEGRCVDDGEELRCEYGTEEEYVYNPNIPIYAKR